ncbi:hypothetical protein VOLCADRAFT_119333 [Volvox carteri f. nagariensis]|uniref:Protein kinase domain-containing protein n=1 Tax=Volvox carteri f. nagariensis TaxID=3068 RepID=D8UCA2_VOLCA|nr:uncharacterized protein VOLCADRAFT_119333 [Volvox carteri f. nagariensis]EFJ42662.1 hypothetical protein VOLCADRAFT_119333 [Volvox carteri f. nagariensis]|eukprot:XP_002956313.1 hypothetical protein VOLCADRAFT_119333 [Volvox carteri f. nagariensis]
MTCESFAGTRHNDGAPPAGVVYAGTSKALYSALASLEVSTVYLTATIKLDRSDWTTAYQAIGSYVTIDFSSVSSAIYIRPGGEVIFRWLEIVNYTAEVGQAMLIVGASPGGRVIFQHVVQRRLAGFGGKQTLDELLQLPRLNQTTGSPNGSSDDHQIAFFLPRFCYNSTRDGAGPPCSTNLVYIVDVATRLGPASSPYFAAGLALGEYDLLLEESVQISDNVVDPNCLSSASASECVVQQLRLLGIEPVLVKAKRSASNLVKIVASLAILLAAVGLFLYFRRHYRTYQERRARRMRRLKEALGMGREAHGIMFNGLDGEIPDWQIMPMPVGYAPDEGGTAELHQNSNIRNLIKDISNRPNRQNPEYDRPEDYEVRIEVDGGGGTGSGGGTGGDGGGGLENCPIAAEVGLLRPPVVPTLLLGPMATKDLEGGDAMVSEQFSPTQVDPGAVSAGAAETPTVDKQRSDGTAAAAAVTVHHIRPSGGSGTTGASHQSASGTSVSHTTVTMPGPPMVTLAAMLAGVGGVGTSAAAGGQSSSSGGRGASQGLEVSTTMAVTKAGLDVLLASRVAAMGGSSSAATAAAAAAAAAAATRSGGGGGSGAATFSIQLGGGGCSQSRSACSRESQTAAAAAAAAYRQPNELQPPLSSSQQQLQQQQQGSGSADTGVQQQQQQQRQQQQAILAAGGDGGGGGGTATATRHAVASASAAVDVANRIMKSKDSDDDDEDEDGGRRRRRRRMVASLMDELEQLRRDIMAGVNDTQLHIMSVVGSGAFGTVYRGQWQGLEVAVKTVVFSASSENRKRALQEAALCQSINHRNIVATYAVDVQPLGAVHNNSTAPVVLGAGPTHNNNNRNSTLSNLLHSLYPFAIVSIHSFMRSLGPPAFSSRESGPLWDHTHTHTSLQDWRLYIVQDLNPNNVLLKRDATSPIGFRVKMAEASWVTQRMLYHGRLAGTRTATGEPRYQPLGIRAEQEAGTGALDGR